MNGADPREDLIHWREDTDPLRLGTVVGRLKGHVDAAIVARDEEAGSPAHRDLVSAEWRLRRAERRGRGKGAPVRPGALPLDGSAPARRACRYCGSVHGRLDPPKLPHGQGVRCDACGRHLGWLPKAKADADGFGVIDMHDDGGDAS